MFCIDKGIFLLIFLCFYPFLSDALQVKYYLHYMFTALTKADTFPEFSAVVVANGRQVKHFSNEESVWVRDGRTVFDWTNTPADPPDSRDWFIHQLKKLSDCTNSQCSELHFLQRIIGCELEKLPNGTTKSLSVFDEYGFDGEDFISFNSDTMKWIDKNPKAKETKMKWDLQTERNQYIKYFLNRCVHWISMIQNTEKCRPDVHVSARKVHNDESKLVLTCLATGFYPRDVQMNIRLDKTKLEDQTSSEIKPNDDETFQMSTSVKIDRNYKGSYDCLVIHNSLKRPASVDWDGKCFDHERESLRQNHYGKILGAVAAVAAVLVFICWRIYKQRGRQIQNVENEESDESYTCTVSGSKQ